MREKRRTRTTTDKGSQRTKHEAKTQGANHIGDNKNRLPPLAASTVLKGGHNPPGRTREEERRQALYTPQTKHLACVDEFGVCVAMRVPRGDGWWWVSEWVEAGVGRKGGSLMAP